jgi:hypothetical protein
MVYEGVGGNEQKRKVRDDARFLTGTAAKLELAF